jgi:endonuclease-3
LADRGLCPSAVVAKSTKVKKEAVVKIEAPNGDEEAVVKEETLVADVAEIKAEDVDGSMDMEDIGQASRKTRQRKK